MSAYVSLWRIAALTAEWRADDLSGVGAQRSGGRWNRKGAPVVYLSTTRALAALETLVAFRASALPTNRMLLEVRVPVASWEGRIRFAPAAHVGWDVVPPGLVSIDWGTEWIGSSASALAEVPSAIVPEESNVLLNPAHPDAARVTARVIRRWGYDQRLSL